MNANFEVILEVYCTKKTRSCKMKEPILHVQTKVPSQQRLVHSVLVLDHYFHFPEKHFVRNTTGSRHHVW